LKIILPHPFISKQLRIFPLTLSPAFAEAASRRQAREKSTYWGIDLEISSPYDWGELEWE
jgi:hypothetical protein